MFHFRGKSAILESKIPKALLCFFLLICLSNSTWSQVRYSIKTEVSYYSHIDHLVDIDPGANWEGYKSNGDGMEFSIINGLTLNKWYFGLGLGYLNIDGYDGLSVYSDINFRVLDYKLSPILGVKVGRSHLWNQYESGTGAAMAEFNIGFSYQLLDVVTIYIQSGITINQESSFSPFTAGISF